MSLEPLLSLDLIQETNAGALSAVEEDYGALDRQLVDEGQVAQEGYDQLGISFRHMVRGTEFGLVRRPGAEMRQLLFGRRGAIVVDVMDRFPTMFDAERGLNVAGR